MGETVHLPLSSSRGREPRPLDELRIFRFQVRAQVIFYFICYNVCELKIVTILLKCALRKKIKGIYFRTQDWCRGLIMKPRKKRSKSGLNNTEETLVKKGLATNDDLRRVKAYILGIPFCESQRSED